MPAINLTSFMAGNRPTDRSFHQSIRAFDDRIRRRLPDRKCLMRERGFVLFWFCFGIRLILSGCFFYRSIGTSLSTVLNFFKGSIYFNLLPYSSIVPNNIATRQNKLMLIVRSGGRGGVSELTDPYFRRFFHLDRTMLQTNQGKCTTNCIALL
jgi:hypothetical protein